MPPLTFDQFAQKVTEAGLKPVDRGKGHWQVAGGPILVNFYPFANKGPVIYIAGTTKRLGRNLAVEDAIQAAKNPPPIGVMPKDRRSGPRRYMSIKKRMFARRKFYPPFCYWCHKSLTLKTATIDHKIPLFRGGLDNENNMVLACEPCNKTRGHDMPEITEGKIG